MSFITDYLLYASDNEAPPAYHLWSGYVALSSAISRKAWLPFGGKDVFCNIYVMLVGDAGDGKSTAMDFLLTLIAHAQQPPPLGVGIHVSGEIETPQGFLRFIAGDPNKAPTPLPSPVKFIGKWPDGELRDCHPMTIIANEFIDFIKPEPEGWISMLNNIYDRTKYRYRTKGQGEDLLIGPYIVMMGGLTTEISHEIQKQHIISTGFARRTLFQYGARDFENPRAIMKQTDAQVAAFNRCVDYVRVLNSPQTGAAFTWTEETQSWWVNWYNAHSTTVRAKPPNVRSWFTSKPNQVLKLGLLTSLSEGLSFELRTEHLETAIQHLAMLEEDLTKVFGGVGRNELAGVSMKMYEYVASLKFPVMMSKVKTAFFQSCRPPHDFDQCIQYLTDSKLLRRQTFADPQTQSMLDLIAPPEVWLEFYVERKLQPPQDLLSLLLALEAEANPSVELSPAPTNHSSPNQVDVPTVAGTETGQLQ